MAVAATPAGTRETVRQKRERDQELLVWPDLVFVEFICAVLFTVTFVGLSFVLNAPLLNVANANVTPDPSKAPWYFMNLQELLLHMDPGLAGVIVPTLLLIGLAAIPYIDRSNEGQGAWFATANSIRITIFSGIYTFVLLLWLIFWDEGLHVDIYERIPALWLSDRRLEWPGDKDVPFGQPVWDFIFLRNRTAARDDWEWTLPGVGLSWPEDFDRIPVPLNGTWIFHWGEPTWMPGWMRALYPYDAHLDLPSILVEYLLPIIAMTLLPALLLFIIWKLGWAHTMRDHMIALFTGFIVTYFLLTIIGVAFRGEAQQLVPVWQVPNLHEDPSIYHQGAPPDYGILDTRTGEYA
jgi:menaquinol-cytochrome c reductase cytochrome b/c subunit